MGVCSDSNDGTEDGFTSTDSVTVASECGLTDVISTSTWVVVRALIWC